jgi:hypothetical protein
LLRSGFSEPKMLFRDRGGGVGGGVGMGAKVAATTGRRCAPEGAGPVAGEQAAVRRTKAMPRRVTFTTRR